MRKRCGKCLAVYSKPLRKGRLSNRLASPRCPRDAARGEVTRSDAETNSTSIRRRRRSTFCDSTVPRHDFLVPNGIANGVARAISVSKNNTCACATDLATGCSTVFEAFSDTSRRQRFFGVGGSGRSPLECVFLWIPGGGGNRRGARRVSSNLVHWHVGRILVVVSEFARVGF